MVCFAGASQKRCSMQWADDRYTYIPWFVVAFADTCDFQNRQTVDDAKMLIPSSSNSNFSEGVLRTTLKLLNLDTDKKSCKCRIFFVLLPSLYAIISTLLFIYSAITFVL